jgi:hypothetical protein
MTPQQKEKLIKRIHSGQSLKMLCWEFKMKEQEIFKFANDNGCIVRTLDFINYANKLEKLNNKK